MNEEEKGKFTLAVMLIVAVLLALFVFHVNKGCPTINYGPPERGHPAKNV